MAHIFAIANRKGGIGKTNVSFNLAGVLAEAGFRILVVDMDEQGSLTSILTGQKSLKPGIWNILYDFIDEDKDDGERILAVDAIRRTGIDKLDLLPSSKMLKNLDRFFTDFSESSEFLDIALEPVRDQYDFIIIDCHSSFKLATTMALIAANGIIIPTECSDLSIAELAETVSFTQEIQQKENPDLALLGVIINKFDSRRGNERIFHDEIQNKFKELVFKAEFRDNNEYAEVSIHGQPVTMSKPHSEQADSYRAFRTEILQRINYSASV